MELIKNFHCLGAMCPNHCCGRFEGVSPRLRAVGTISFQDIVLLPEDKSAIQEIGRSDLIIEKAGLSFIKTAPDGTCSSLLNGRCSIYAARPSICRCFPLYLDLFTGICIDEGCPAADGVLYTALGNEAKESLFKVYEFWINFFRTYEN